MKIFTSELMWFATAQTQFSNRETSAALVNSETYDQKLEIVVEINDD